MIPQKTINNLQINNEPEYFDEIDLDEIGESEGGYKWRGVDSLGRELKLESYAKTPHEVDRELLDVGIQMTSLRPLNLTKRSKHLPKQQELAMFARNFGEQIEAGNTAKNIIKMLAEAEVNPTMEAALLGAYTALENGREIYEAFEMQQDEKGRAVFPREMVSAFQIGERIGVGTNPETGKKVSGLYLTLSRFAEGQEKAYKIIALIRSAMIYPIAVGLTAIGAIAAVSIFVMPMMKGLYESLLQGKDTQLPILTRIMLGISDFIWSWAGLAAIIIAIGIFIKLWKWWKSPAGQEFKGRFIIYLPKVGNFYRMLYAAQLLRYLSMLLAGGLEMKQTLQLASETTQNPIFREMLENLRYQYRVQGKALTPMFKPYLWLFGREFLGTLMTADESGDPAAPFLRYAQILEFKVDRQLEDVLTIMKNAIIFPLGLVVALVVASIILPFFELAGRIGG